MRLHLSYYAAKDTSSIAKVCSATPVTVKYILTPVTPAGSSMVNEFTPSRVLNRF